MTRKQLKNNIMNICTDPYTDGDQEYEPITSNIVPDMLKELFQIQKDCELDPDECVPENIEPSLFMELYNEIAAEHNADLRKRRILDLLSECIEKECCVCEYDSFLYDFISEYQTKLEEQICPMDWLDDEDEPLELNALPVSELIGMIRNSPRFNMDHEYYTMKDGKLISTNNPFRDGIVSAKPMACYMIEHDEDYGNDDFRKILNGEEID